MVPAGRNESFKDLHGLKYRLRAQGRVILAVMLRDLRTRFFGHGLGFLVAIAWPLGHIVMLLLLFNILQRATPYGENPVLYFATALAPFMTFSYLSRFAMMSMLANRPLLNFPIVRPLDIIFARCLLEGMGSICMVVFLLSILWATGTTAWPYDPIQAFFAFSAALLLGMSFGLLNAVIVMAFPGWAIIYTLSTILLYVTSGIFFVAETLPEKLRYIVSWNPAMHPVEWMRQAYFPSYGKDILDKPYLFMCCLVALFSGLVIERFFREYLVRSK